MTLEYAEVQGPPQQAPPAPVPRKVRGTLTIKSDDDLEFRAQRSTGLSSQEEISHTRQSKLYRTRGEKKNKMVAHLTVDPDSADPAADLHAEVDRLAAALPQTKGEPRLRGRRLLQKEGLRVTLQPKERRVEVVMTIDLKEHPNYTDRLMKLMYETSQCFAINQTFLVPPRK